MGTHHLVNDMDNKLVLYYDWLNRIHVRAEFLQQVERAPHVYAAMVVEVARRRLFSQHYMKVLVLWLTLSLPQFAYSGRHLFSQHYMKVLVIRLTLSLGSGS